MDEARILDRNEFRELVEGRIRERFAMTLTEFAEAFRSGALDEDPAALDLALISGASSQR